MRCIYPLALVLALSNAVAGADDTVNFPGVQGLMSDDEYRAAGLGKLSDEERKALDEWLIRYTAWQAPELREKSAEIRALEEDTGFTANLKGPFTGWSGKTRFYLDNGQVWQQRLSGRFHYGGDDTAVAFHRNSLGFYMMEHLASGRSVGVKRIQ